MILDKQNLFSEDQEVTATAASTNVIDLGADHASAPTPNIKESEIMAQVTTAFADGTSLKVTLQSDDDVSFGSPTTVVETAAIPTASLVAGYKFALSQLPAISERYIRLNYTVVGTMSAGKIMAGLVLRHQGV